MLAGLAALALLAAPSWAAAQADDIVGVWATDPEGEGGQAHIEIFKEKGTYHGRIVWLEEPVYLPDNDEGMPPGNAKVDNNNPDEDLRDRPIIGLQIMQGFSWAGDGEWKGGTIYDPDNGKTYKCKMRLDDDDVLHVRGFIGFSLLGRTSEWTRVEPAHEGAGK
jgi:uncharacterized protein (DUF2147 family)